MVMAVRQISITLDEELLRFLDEWGYCSASVAEAVRQWRDPHLALGLLPRHLRAGG